MIIPTAELATPATAGERVPNWREAPADESGANEKIKHEWTPITGRKRNHGLHEFHGLGSGRRVVCAAERAPSPETIFFLPQKKDLTQSTESKESPILQILSFCRKIRVISVIHGFAFAFL